MGSQFGLRRDDRGPDSGMTVRARIPEQILSRNPDSVEVADTPTVHLKYIALSLLKMKEQISQLAKMAEDNSRPVDEYLSQTLVPDSVTQLTIPPQWEVGELIQSVVITGPTATPQFTLQLGDRTWNLTLPASGILVIAPIRLLLGRSDNRVLTSPTAGQWTVELMGICDDRY